MNIIDRYIGKKLALTILIVLIALLSVDIFFYLVNELRHVGQGNYDIVSALNFIALTIPRKIYILFPWSALLGSLLSLGHLARNSELVAMNVARISIIRIAGSALKTGIILTTLMFICGEVIAPVTEFHAQRKKMLAVSKGQAIQAHFGTWIRNFNEFIHIVKVIHSEELHNVTRYKLDSNNLHLQSVIHANIAKKTNDKWNLFNVNGTILNSGITTFTVNEMQEEKNMLDASILQASTIKHLELLTLKNLYQVIEKRLAQELNAVEYQHAFWLKIMQPFAALVMIFLSVPFVFGPLRSTSFGLKLLVGIFVGFSFYTINSIFGPLTMVLGVPPFMAAFIPVFIFFIIGCWLIYRISYF